MPYVISCSACAFQQVVYDDGDYDELKSQHEAKRGADHVVSIGE